MEKPKDYSQHIAMITFTLMCIGVVMVYSAKASYNFEFSWYRTLLYVVAIVLTLAFSLVPYQWYSMPSSGEIRSRIEEARQEGKSAFGAWLRGVIRVVILPAFMLLTLTLLVLVLAGFGEKVNNSVRWIKVGPVQFQPSEMAKYCVIFYVSWFVVRYNFLLEACSFKNTVHQSRLLFTGRGSWKSTFIFLSKLGACFAVPAAYFVLVVINDFGTGAFICLLVAIILLLGGLPGWMIGACSISIAPVLALFVWLRPYRVKRILAFMFDSSEYDDINYQQLQSLMAISNGGFWGKGVGRGVCKWGAVPEDNTDFIFAIICEEFGAIGAFLVIGLFVMLLGYGVKVARDCEDKFGKILAFTISASFTIQAMINILVVVKMLPNKGIPLPFISAGGTSLFISCIGIGILMNIARQNASVGQLQQARDIDLDDFPSELEGDQP